MLYLKNTYYKFYRKKSVLCFNILLTINNRDFKNIYIFKKYIYIYILKFFLNQTFFLFLKKFYVFFFLKKNLKIIEMSTFFYKKYNILDIFNFNMESNIKFKFKLRNLYISYFFNTKNINYSMGLFCKRSYKNSRSKMMLQLSSVKSTILINSFNFENYLNIYFNKPSNRVILIINIFKKYIEFLNEKKKKSIFFLNSINLCSPFNFLSLKGKKKPRKKKSFRKKSSKYIF